MEAKTSKQPLIKADCIQVPVHQEICEVVETNDQLHYFKMLY
jgi:hypothetical protein